MPEQSVSQLEGRLSGLRDIVLFLLEREMDRGKQTDLLQKLDEMLEAPDHQEDPGAVNVEATAIQTAAKREIEHIVQAVRARHASQ